jgi:hypothetical protein
LNEKKTGFFVWREERSINQSINQSINEAANVRVDMPLKQWPSVAALSLFLNKPFIRNSVLILSA